MKWRRRKSFRVPPDVRDKLRTLERIIGYRFHQPALLWNALKHRSYLNSSGKERIESNERLEFLGDAVLDLVASEHLYQSQSGEEEGILTGDKSTLVSGPVLAAQARKIGLGHYLFLSENEAKSGGRDRVSILEDAFEGLIGAIYLDGRLKSARRFIHRFLLADADGILAEKSLQNYKSVLQEYAQAQGWDPPVYIVLEETGPDHDKRYLIEVRLRNQLLGTGEGRTKKEAEQRAAEEGTKKLDLLM